MFSVDIDASDLDRAWREDGIQGLNAGLASAVKEATGEGAKEALNTRIYQDRTAQLTASVQGGEYLVITADGAEGEVSAGETYASYVNDWEAKKLAGEGFMDHGAKKAEEILTARVDDAAAEAERRINRR